MKSNCFLEALKAKLKDPQNVQIHILPSKLNYGMLHFYWVKEGTIYHYIDPKENKTVFYRLCHPLFSGIYKKAKVESFEKLLYSRMLEQCWSREKQLAYAKAKNFSTLPD